MLFCFFSRADCCKPWRVLTHRFRLPTNDVLVSLVSFVTEVNWSRSSRTDAGVRVPTFFLSCVWTSASWGWRILGKSNKRHIVTYIIYSIRVRYTLLTYHTFITMYRYDSTSTFQSVLGTFNHILDTILRYLSVGVPIQPLKRCELTPFIFIEISTVQPWNPLTAGTPPKKWVVWVDVSPLPQGICSGEQWTKPWLFEFYRELCYPVI